MLPGETPEHLATRLGLPIERVETEAGGVIVIGRLSQAQIEEQHRAILRNLQERHPEWFGEAVEAVGTGTCHGSLARQRRRPLDA